MSTILESIAKNIDPMLKVVEQNEKQEKPMHTIIGKFSRILQKELQVDDASEIVKKLENALKYIEDRIKELDTIEGKESKIQELSEIAEKFKKIQGQFEHIQEMKNELDDLQKAIGTDSTKEGNILSIIAGDTDTQTQKYNDLYSNLYGEPTDQKSADVYYGFKESYDCTDAVRYFIEKMSGASFEDGEGKRDVSIDIDGNNIHITKPKRSQSMGISIQTGFISFEHDSETYKIPMNRFITALMLGSLSGNHANWDKEGTRGAMTVDRLHVYPEEKIQLEQNFGDIGYDANRKLNGQTIIKFFEKLGYTVTSSTKDKDQTSEEKNRIKKEPIEGGQTLSVEQTDESKNYKEEISVIKAYNKIYSDKNNLNIDKVIDSLKEYDTDMQLKIIGRSLSKKIFLEMASFSAFNFNKYQTSTKGNEVSGSEINDNARDKFKGDIVSGKCRKWKDSYIKEAQAKIQAVGDILVTVDSYVKEYIPELPNSGENEKLTKDTILEKIDAKFDMIAELEGEIGKYIGK